MAQITSLYDVDVILASNGEVEDVYIYVRQLDLWSSGLPDDHTMQEELMETNLQSIVRHTLPCLSHVF